MPLSREWRRTSGGAQPTHATAPMTKPMVGIRVILDPLPYWLMNEMTPSSTAENSPTIKGRWESARLANKLDMSHSRDREKAKETRKGACRPLKDVTAFEVGPRAGCASHIGKVSQRCGEAPWRLDPQNRAQQTSDMSRLPLLRCR